jgi:FkbM family methyltransferase
MSVRPKAVVKAIAKSLGYRIVRWSTLPSPFEVQMRLLEGRTAPTIFDVGANDGETALRYRSLFPDASIHCFEPLPTMLPELQARFASDPRIFAVGKAVAEQPGTLPFFINASAVHSSMYELDEAGRRAYCDHDTRVDVDVTTLDAYAAEQSIDRIDLLKMDIQGAELRALRGAETLLRDGRIAVIYLEAWLVPHYKDAPLLYDIVAYVTDFGYRVFDIFNQTRDSTGQLVKVDAILIGPAIRAELEAKQPTWRSARRQEQ